MEDKMIALYDELVEALDEVTEIILDQYRGRRLPDKGMRKAIENLRGLIARAREAKKG